MAICPAPDEPTAPPSRSPPSSARDHLPSSASVDHHHHHGGGCGRTARRDEAARGGGGGGARGCGGVRSHTHSGGDGDCGLDSDAAAAAAADDDNDPRQQRRAVAAAATSGGGHGARGGRGEAAGDQGDTAICGGASLDPLRAHADRARASAVSARVVATVTGGGGGGGGHAGARRLVSGGGRSNGSGELRSAAPPQRLNATSLGVAVGVGLPAPTAPTALAAPSPAPTAMGGGIIAVAASSSTLAPVSRTGAGASTPPPGNAAALQPAAAGGGGAPAARAFAQSLASLAAPSRVPIEAGDTYDSAPPHDSAAASGAERERERDARPAAALLRCARTESRCRAVLRWWCARAASVGSLRLRGRGARSSIVDPHAAPHDMPMSSIVAGTRARTSCCRRRGSALGGLRSSRCRSRCGSRRSQMWFGSRPRSSLGSISISWMVSSSTSWMALRYDTMCL